MKKFRRIAAMVGVVILAGLYVVTLILAITASPATRNLLMASIVCTVVIPVLLYAMMLVARVLGGSDRDGDDGGRTVRKEDSDDKKRDF